MTTDCSDYIDETIFSPDCLAVKINDRSWEELACAFVKEANEVFHVASFA